MRNIINFKDFHDLNESSSPKQNIIVGDSQVPFIARNTKNASTLTKEGSVEGLWKGGMGIDWLKSALKVRNPDKNILNVIVCIGTNGGFNIQRSDIDGLYNELRRCFPSASLIFVKGSWGWGGNKNVTTEKVNAFYDKFKNLGGFILETPIGKVNDPHGNLPVYKQIGREIDDLITAGLPASKSNAEEVKNDASYSKPEKASNVSKRLLGPGEYTTSESDPYIYKVMNGMWYTKGNTLKNWVSLQGNKKALDILDNQFPEAR
jgi:hypothetical protein